MTVHLWIAAGQSKMLGFGHDLTTLPAHLNGANFNYGPTYIFGMNATWWGQITPGVNTGSANLPQAWGPLAQAAYDFRQEHPDDILLIVQWSPGSTGVAMDPTQGDWSPASVGEAFDMMTSRLLAARNALSDPALFDSAQKTLLWVGSETDATDYAKALVHGANFDAFLAASKAVWGWEKAVVARVDQDMVLAQDQMVAESVYAVDEARPDTYSFGTKGYGVASDGIHGTTEFNVLVGHSLFDGWEMAW